MQNDLLFIQNTSTDSTEYGEKFVNLTANKVVFVDTNNLPTTTGIGLSTQFLKADGSLDSIIYEPILPETPVNPDNKYLNGNRLWSEISIGAGGYAGNVYASNIDSDISGYKTMSYTLDSTESVRSIVVNNNTVSSETCLYDSMVGVTVIPSGLWKATFYAKVNSTIGDTTLKIQVFTRHLADGSETDLFEITSPTIENTADYAILRFEGSQIAFTVLETDRVGIRIKGSTTRTQNTTINYIIGDGRGLYITTPLQIRHSQLRDLNGDTNYLHVTSTEKSTWNSSVPYTGATTNVDLGLNYLNVNALKLDGAELLIDVFKSGSLGAAGTIPYSVGSTSTPLWGSINQVIGNNALTNTYLPLFNGTNFANSSISDNGSFVDFSRNQIQMSGNYPTITTNTSDGADTKRLALGGGGALSGIRGASLYLAGNEYTPNPGALVLASGYITGSYIDFLPQGTSAMRLNSTSLSLLQTSGSLKPYTFTIGGNTARTIGLERKSTTNSNGSSLSIFGGGATELMVSTVSITNGGTGYSINDVLTLSTDNAGVEATLTVTSVSGGVIDGVSITTKGSKYLTGDHTTTVSPVGGTGAIINVLTTESATDANGGTLALSSGVSTGTGSGTVLIRTPQPSVSGNTDNTLIARVFIKDDAVGIGSSTAPISGTLDVNASTGGILNLRRSDVSVSANDMVGKIQFYANDASTTSNFITADIEAQAVSTITTDINPGRLIFRTTPTTVAATPVEAVRITEKQNLLVGTTDDNGTPASGRVVIKGSTNDGTTNIFVGRDSNETNVARIDTDGNAVFNGYQESAKVKQTIEGGIAIKLTNKTGANSVKGTVVYADPAVNSAFKVNPINGDMPFGVVYESGIVDRSECWVVVAGIAEVLLVNTVASTRSYIAYSSSSVAGRIDTSANVPDVTTHFREIGHTMESKTGGTDVLCKCVLHFN